MSMMHGIRIGGQHCEHDSQTMMQWQVARGSSDLREGKWSVAMKPGQECVGLSIMLHTDTQSSRKKRRRERGSEQSIDGPTCALWSQVGLALFFFLSSPVVVSLLSPVLHPLSGPVFRSAQYSCGSASDHKTRPETSSSHRQINKHIPSFTRENSNPS